MMTNTITAPTISEIQAWRDERTTFNHAFISRRIPTYHIGSVVRFKPPTTAIRTGKITNIINCEGAIMYHILTQQGAWYRNIAQSEILKS